MKRLEQLSKGLGKTRRETALNTRNLKAYFPLVERKLDILAANDHTYSMDFPLTKHDHAALLTITIKPDNCCDCDPGATTLIRDGEAYYQGGRIGPSNEYEFNKAYPAIYVSDISQTGSTFNMGWPGVTGFTYPIYQAFDSFGGYGIAANGRISVPVDGVYSILFQCSINGTIQSGAATLIQSIRRDTVDDLGQPYTETLSKKIYSVSKGNLSAGGGPPNELNPNHLVLYATCVNLNVGDTIGGWLEINDISSFHAAGGWLGDGGGFGDERNNTHLTLLGRGYGILLGYVYDISDHSPIQGATISYANEFGGKTLTDEFGGYAFYTLTPGTYTMTATMAGYITQTQAVAVHFNKVSYIDFNLTHI